MDYVKRREEELAAFGRELHDTERNVLAARAALEAAEDAWIEEMKKQKCAVVSAGGKLWEVSSIEGRTLNFLFGYRADKNVRECTPPTRQEMEIFMRDQLMHTLARRHMSAEEVLAIKAILRAIPITDAGSDVLAATEVEWSRGIPTGLPHAVMGDYVETRDYQKSAPADAAK